MLKSMVKQSVAKTKKLAAEAKRTGAARRAEKKARDKASTPESDHGLDKYEAVDGNWRELGLGAPARRALIDDGLFTLSDLRKISLAALKELHGIGPNAIRVLVAEMKKADLSFRK
jgi:predicted flap endonuclease-1-like 5' DNA nuclease